MHLTQNWKIDNFALEFVNFKAIVIYLQIIFIKLFKFTFHALISF